MKIIIKEIKHNSPEYKFEIEVRSKILREPLGLKFISEDFANEEHEIHLGAFQETDDKLIGCLILKNIDASIFKMRQVAISSSMQGSGVGKLLVYASEKKARELGGREIQLNARETAIPFYLKLGYQIVSEPFVEVGIIHQKMKKEI